jgi:hypothetical protein
MRSSACDHLHAIICMRSSASDHLHAITSEAAFASLFRSPMTSSLSTYRQIIKSLSGHQKPATPQHQTYAQAPVPTARKRTREFNHRTRPRRCWQPHPPTPTPAYTHSRPNLLRPPSTHLQIIRHVCVGHHAGRASHDALEVVCAYLDAGSTL